MHNAYAMKLLYLTHRTIDMEKLIMFMSVFIFRLIRNISITKYLLGKTPNKKNIMFNG